jgi:hypothetical protein
LIAAPLASLLLSSVASADTPGDVVTLGPYSIDGYEDTFSYNNTTLGVDNFLTGTYDKLPFDLDVFIWPSGSGPLEVLLTDPGVFQFGVDDVDGSFSYIDNFFGIDFIPTDPGLDLLGGL